MTTKKEIYQDGVTRGCGIACYCEIPELGIEVTSASMGKITLNEDNLLEYLVEVCSESEELDRQVSPFEFTARELNSLDKPYDVWEVFEEGIYKGIYRCLKNRLK